jgi:GrpB-like predicted nucleotidyltransferase (UPF0157 family)
VYLDAMADGSLEIADYDPTWPDRFEEQASQVAVLLAPWLAGPVEHVGSTAVPGLPAKPVIDMLAPVRCLAEAEEAVGRLAADGWLFWADDPNRSWRLWFLRPRPEARTHHLHMIEHGRDQARAMVAFRDTLQANGELRREYAQLKRRLARQHADNRNVYTNAKTGFVESALRAGGIELPPMEQLPE